MGRRRLGIIAWTLAGACSAGPSAQQVHPQLSRQNEALRVVWELELGAPAEIEASPIEWVVGQPCTPGSAWPAMVYNGRCVGGLYSFDLATVVEARDGFPAFSSTAFTHELVHAFLFKTTGDQDGGHARPEWSHVASGNDALAAAGL